MDSNEIRSRFLKFFEHKSHGGHKIISSSSLIPENDPSVLFTTAGMQQFKPYYTGEKDAEKDFGSKNVATVQKCVRTVDIDEVGDDTHITFFEMLGNFSFGGYWKKEAIEYAYEFITKELGLAIDYVSVFEGDTETPADRESGEIWKNIDSKLTIKNHNRADNFWGPTGEEGPCGPTTEIYINGVEIWNIVFNEFYKTREGKYEPLKQRGIDTGMGLERLLVQVQKKNSIYETDLFLDTISSFSNFVSLIKKRITADHIRTATFMIADGVIPSNKDRGYVLRRLLRRASMHLKGSEPGGIYTYVGKVINKYSSIYNNLAREKIFPVIKDEIEKFEKTLSQGLRAFEKQYSIKDLHQRIVSGRRAAYFFTSFGIPKEVFLDLIREKQESDQYFKEHLKLSENFETEYEEEFKKHQELSRTFSVGIFKGGLADYGEKTIKLHTAHHLLLAALQAVLSPEIRQRGSNITSERLRIDFAFERKLTDEEKQKVEDWVNDKISRGLDVIRREMPLAEAEKLGAQMEFGAKYGETVSVYFIEDAKGSVVSKEFCGGPHVSNTKGIGDFKIQKEEAVSSGVRRIKAVLL